MTKFNADRLTFNVQPSFFQEPGTRYYLFLGIRALTPEGPDKKKGIYYEN